MLARILSHAVFWPLMTVLVLGALVFVLVVYFPFVALKAVVLGITGKIGEATGRKKRNQSEGTGSQDSGPVRMPG